MKKGKKRCELGELLHLISLDFTKKMIKKRLGIKPTTLANRLRRLEEMGCIEREGKYLIKILRSSLNHPRVTINQVNKKLNKRGHAFNFRIVFPQETEDLNKKEKVLRLFYKRDKNKPEKRWLEKLPFGSMKFKYKRNTIWINKESITIYSNNSYYSDNALHSKFRVLKDIDLIIKYLKRKFDFKGIYGIEIFREHYGLIFNKFAEWILSRGGKLKVQNLKNKIILWVDDSRKDDIGLKEFEGDNPIKINSADELFESHEKTGWKITPEYNLKQQEETNKQIKALAIQSKKTEDKLEYFGENMVSHVAIMKKIDKRLEKMNERDESFLRAIEKLGKN